MGHAHWLVGPIVILLTVRDLGHRFVRFVVVVVLAAVVFALLFVMTGLVEQFNREPYDTTAAIGGSAWVLADGVTGPFTASSSLPIAVIDAIDAEVKAPVVAARSSLGHDGSNEEIVVVGHPPGELGQPPLSHGRAVTGPGQIVLDSSLGVAAGEQVLVAGERFDVVGLSDDTTILAGIPLVFMSLDDAQRLVFRSPDVVSGFLVDGAVGDLPEGTVLIPADDVASDTLKPLDGAISSIELVRVLLWVVAAIIVGSVVYLSALERQRDFAVLKAVGVSNRTLLGSLALQAVLIALLSVAIAAVVQMFVGPAFPLRVRVPARAFWQLPVLAVVMALVAGIAGMRRVVRSDPALAFAAGA
ncbi:MAG TPA: ABC transporter permease [Ilumatobacter sp.]